MKTLIAILTAVLVTANANAFMTAGDTGSAGGGFLKLGAGAEAASMGEAYTAIVSDSTALYWNPAGLNKVTTGHVSLMHSLYIESVFYDYLSVAYRLKDTGVIGIGAQYVNYGTLTQTDALGNTVADLSAYDLCITGSFAKEFGNISAGISVKYLTSKIVNTASAFAGDIGVQTSFMEKKLQVGLAVQNIGTQLTYVSVASPLPLSVKLGLAYDLMPALTVAADFSAPMNSGIEYAGGARYTLALGTGINGKISAGYNSRLASTGGLGGFSFGAGIDMNKYSLSYALVPFGDLGMAHRLSIGLEL